MAETPESRFSSNIQPCCDWADFTKEFDQLPKPILRRDEDGEPYQEGWIFRGHKSRRYLLEPSIERTCPNGDWAAMEHQLLREFQSKARMHLDIAQLPQAAPGDKLSWLSIMQHYGAPTRLLDFTYSPYVALYFALRNRGKHDGPYAEVWGIDTAALRRRAAETIRAADQEGPKKQGEAPRGGRVGSTAEEQTSSLQQEEAEGEFWETAIRNALSPCGARREHFNRNGLVAVALPPMQNSRLSSQQGVFLLNGAEDRTFEVSLELMMRSASGQWYRRFQVPEEALAEIEKRLFQVNIHDLSLFPDTEGLAVFVRQKIRLHW